MLVTLPALVLTGALAAVVLALVLAERRGATRARAGLKALASTLFLALALALDAPGSAYGRIVLLALSLSWLGDVLLIPRGRGPAFLAGLGAFLLGHAAYAGAFLAAGARFTWAAIALPIVGAAALLVAQWVLPHASARMRAPVTAYLLVITVMVALGVATVPTPLPLLAPAGAVLFAASDVAVARERFVHASWWNKAWGLPAYYAAQALLAWSVTP